MHPAHRPETLTDRRGSGGFILNDNLYRVFQISRGNPSYLLRHGSRKKRNLSFLRCLLKNPLNVINKSHPQHFICFIQNKCAELIKFQSTAAHVIHHASWSSNHYMGSTLQTSYLPTIFLTSVNRQHMKTFHMRCIFFKGFCDLNRQLSGRRKDQNLRVFLP